MTDAVGDAARAAVRLMAREHVETLAQRLAAGASAAAVLDAVALPTYRDATARVLSAIAVAGADPKDAAAYLRALAEGYALGRTDQHVEVVWSGPTYRPCSRGDRPGPRGSGGGRSDSGVDLDELLRAPYPPLTDALRAAVSTRSRRHGRGRDSGRRGRRVVGEEPAAAFLAVPGVQVWHWPGGRRPEQSSKMHAKLRGEDELEDVAGYS